MVFTVVEPQRGPWTEELRERDEGRVYARAFTAFSFGVHLTSVGRGFRVLPPLVVL